MSTRGSSGRPQAPALWSDGEAPTAIDRACQRPVNYDTVSPASPAFRLVAVPWILGWRGPPRPAPPPASPPASGGWARKSARYAVPIGPSGLSGDRWPPGASVHVDFP